MCRCKIITSNFASPQLLYKQISPDKTHSVRVQNLDVVYDSEW